MSTTVQHPPLASVRSRRGWSVIAGLLIVLTTASGLGFYGLAVYLSALNRVRGFSVSGMSLATALFFVCSGLGGVYVAKLLRTVDPRPIATVGAALAAASLVMLGRVTQLWQVYVVYAAFGLSYALSGLVISTTLVARWFDRQRAVALSIASTGLSFGGVVLTPWARRLLSSSSLTHGTLVLAIVYVVGVVPAAWLFLRPWPAKYGLGADGFPAASTVADAAPVRGVSFERAVKAREFFGITVSFLLALGAQVGAIAQLDKLAHERITGDGAGRIVSVIAACSVVGRLVGSAVYPKLGGRRFVFIILGGQTVGLALLSQAHGASTVTLSAIVFGLMIGNVLLLHPLLLATAFGVRDYPRIYGRSQAWTMIGVAGGPFLYGFLRDHAGGYSTSYGVGAAISVVALSVYARSGGDGSELAD